MRDASAACYFLALAAASFLLEVLTLPGMLLHAAGGAFAPSAGWPLPSRALDGGAPALVIPIAAFVGAGTAGPSLGLSRPAGSAAMLLTRLRAGSP
jgi:hypothetical protein